MIRKNIIVMKFGGTSMGSAERILEVKNILKKKLEKETHRVGLVLSAVSGVTNMLVDITKGINRISEIKSKHMAIISALNLGKNFETKCTAIVEDSMLGLEGYILTKSGTFDDEAYCKIVGLGERLSNAIFSEVLKAEGIAHLLIDPVDYIITEGDISEGEPIKSEVEKHFSKLLNKTEPVILMAGFICGNLNDGVIKHGLLGRNGSDFSGSIMAYGLNADCYENWTDVNGVYTADPRKIESAVFVNEMNYNEISILAKHGAKVLHHKTVDIIAGKNIPIYIKNTFNPSAEGTKISNTTSTLPIKGITVLENISFVDVSFEDKALIIKVKVLINELNNNHSLGLQIVKDDAHGLAYIIKDNKVELFKSLISSKLKKMAIIKLYNEISGLCLVGKDIGSKILINEKFNEILKSVKTKVIFKRAEQDHIYALVAKQEANKLMEVTHRRFFENKNLVVFLFGVGNIGRAFIENLQTLAATTDINVKLIGISSSTKALYNSAGIDLDRWREEFNKLSSNMSSQDIISKIKADYTHNQCIVVDCTSSKDLAREYVEILNSGINIVTASKLANSSTLDYYNLIRQAEFNSKTKFLYGANVGAGTPVINLIKDLKRSGDGLISFQGVMSGSLSTILAKLEEGVPFSEAVKLAVQSRSTEPDPRVDLSGVDVASKVLIIAREFGLNIEFSDIALEPFLPKEIKGSIDEFLNKIKSFDEGFKERISLIRAKGQILRYVGKIENGKCKVGFEILEKDHMLANIGEGENVFSFLTQNYNPQPIVIRGYGAGVKVTAAGILRDVVKIGIKND